MSDIDSDSNIQPPESTSVSRRQLLTGALAGSASLIALPALSACGSSSSSTSTSANAPAKRGGQLRVGIVGGGSTEQLDPNLGNTEVDVLRNRAIFEGLVEFDPQGNVVNQLAEELVPNKDGSIWTIKLRPDIHFHNGKVLTADDVVYTLNYFLTPATKSLNYSLLAPNLARSGIRKVDSQTVQLNLTRPHSLLPQVLGERTVKIFPDGSTAAQLGTDPIGTGPFVFKSWTRGERSLFLRNPYWFARGAFGPTYVDSLEILSITDATARVNALTGGQVDAVADIGPALATTVSGNSALTLLEGASGAFTEFYMDTQTPPFTDNNVRLAFKMMINREEMLANTLSGHGRLGNDLSSWFDPAYPSALPQRTYDPEQAKALLKKAGHEDMTIQLITGDFAEASLQSATLFANQAQSAGVTIKLKTIPGDEYYSVFPRSPWAQSNWGGRLFVPFAQYAFVPGAPDNETRWSNSDFNDVFFAALKTTDPTQRQQYLVDAQTILWKEGGYMIWGFTNNLDATTSKLKGFVNSVIRPLDYYDMSHVYFA